MIENKNVSSLSTYRTFYRYDEAGNRVNKKQYLYIIGIPPGGTGLEGGPAYGDSIIVDVGDGRGYWSMVGNTYYVRDISGKEIAIYYGSSLTQWNIWGLDNPPGGGQVIGKINADTTRNYYLLQGSPFGKGSPWKYQGCVWYNGLCSSLIFYRPFGTKKRIMIRVISEIRGQGFILFLNLAASLIFT